MKKVVKKKMKRAKVIAGSTSGTEPPESPLSQPPDPTPVGSGTSGPPPAAQRPDPEMGECGACGNLIPMDVPACPECGAVFVDVDAPELELPKIDPTPPKLDPFSDPDIGFIIELKVDEKENITYDQDRQIVNRSAVGVVEYVNPSGSARLWDVVMNLSDLSQISLEEADHHLKELAPNESFTKDYEIHDRTMIDFKEDIRILTPEGGELDILVHGSVNTVQYRLTIHNLRDHEIAQITLEKELPDYMDDTQITETYRGDVQIAPGSLVWEVSNLPANGSETLVVQGSALADSIAPRYSGRTYVTYEAAASISGVQVEQFKAKAKQMAFVDMDERDTLDSWDCRLIFKNRSEYGMKLSRVQITDSQSGANALDFSGEEFISSQTRWESAQWSVDSKTKPEFSNEIEASVLHRVKYHAEGSLIYEGQQIYSASVLGTKGFTEGEIQALRDSEFQAWVRVENSGSADLVEVDVVDSIPGVLVAPDISAIGVEFRGQKLTATSGGDGVNISARVEPAQASEGMHMLRVDMDFEDSAVLRPGEFIVLSYPLEARSPKEKAEYQPGATIRVATKREGAKASFALADIPDLNVVHVVRRLSVGKAVEPIGRMGQYSVTLLYINRGEYPLEDVWMQDVVPGGFEFVRCDDEEPMVIAAGGSTILRWHYDSIPPGEEVELSFTVRGEGEYESGAATMGSEAELEGPKTIGGMPNEIPDPAPLREETAGPDDELLGLMDSSTDTPPEAEEPESETELPELPPSEDDAESMVMDIKRKKSLKKEDLKQILRRRLEQNR